MEEAGKNMKQKTFYVSLKCKNNELAVWVLLNKVCESVKNTYLEEPLTLRKVRDQTDKLLELHL